jgi:hypothetical protein
MAQEPRADDSTVVVWEPRSKPQAALIACPVFEVFFGGSRGSLKTDSVLGDWINHSAIYGEFAVGLMVRRTREELSETYERAKAIFTPLGFSFNDSTHICRGPDGSRLRFAYLDRDSDAERYQGHSYTRVYVEEIGNFPNPGPVMRLMATLRSANGVPTGFRATGNPGGPGHHWVKARYIDPAPLGWAVQKYEYKNPFDGSTVVRDRVFIPGKITDHSLLGPEYIAQLQMSGSEKLVRAWLLGDWDVIEGAFFDCWSDKIVVAPFTIPDHWLRFRSFDWGFARPFSVGWWAIASEDHSGIPKGAMVRYREWYGSTAPNVGLRLTVEKVAEGIAEREFGDKITYGVADPSIFAEDGGPSLAERMWKSAKLVWNRADNTRIAKSGHMGGWDQMRARMIGDEKPMIYCFSTCVDSIRTIPALQHDDSRAEDLDSEGEDHAADEWRYACMSRPYTRPAPGKTEPKRGIENATFDELLEMNDRAHREDPRI